MKVRVLWVLLLVRKLEGSKLGLEGVGWKGLVALCEFFSGLSCTVGKEGAHVEPLGCLSLLLLLALFFLSTHSLVWQRLAESSTGAMCSGAAAVGAD